MYLEGLIAQVEVFASRAGVSLDDVLVRLVFSSGDDLIARGIKQIVQPFGQSAWGMVMVQSSSGMESVLIRESDIYKIELQVVSVIDPIGFATEGKSAGTS